MVSLYNYKYGYPRTALVFVVLVCSTPSKETPQVRPRDQVRGRARRAEFLDRVPGVGGRGAWKSSRSRF